MRVSIYEREKKWKRGEKEEKPLASKKRAKSRNS